VGMATEPNQVEGGNWAFDLEQNLEDRRQGELVEGDPQVGMVGLDQVGKVGREDGLA